MTNQTTKSGHRAELDPRTGRPFGDHGSALDAINFLLSHHQAPGEEAAFLRRWREGDLGEWPEYYEWLSARAALSKAEATALTGGNENG